MANYLFGKQIMLLLNNRRVNLDKRGEEMIEPYTDLYWLPLDYANKQQSRFEFARSRFSAYETNFDELLDRR